MTKIRVLIVDDSSLVRDILSNGLSQDPDLEVVGKASDPYKARDLIIEQRPDVMTLDVEMPRMDGLEFLRKLMPQYPIPVVMVSALTERGSEITLNALAYGALDFVTKPAADLQFGLAQMMEELRAKIKVAARVNVQHWRQRYLDRTNLPEKVHSLATTTDKVIAVGASTGGTEALRRILEMLPADTPGMVVVQHMPAGFTKMFADRLNSISAMTVKEAQSGDRVMTGHVLIAPGNFHMQLLRSGGEYRVVCRDGALTNGHRPSVDVLFRSVAKFAGRNAVGIMLTGMGRDGADAMLKLRQAGARTMAQDEESCVVFGMPKEAWERGAAECLVPLDDIPLKIKEYLHGI